MTYPDLQFVISLLVIGEYSGPAAQLLRDVAHPLPLSLLHRLQIENALLRLLHGPDEKQSEIARAGLRTWRRYLDEQVFAIRKFDLEAAFLMAAAWNAGLGTKPPKWGLLLHPALAATSGAIFLSFDSALREQAAAEGLDVLPN